MCNEDRSNPCESLVKKKMDARLLEFLQTNQKSIYFRKRQGEVRDIFQTLLVTALPQKLPL